MSHFRSHTLLQKILLVVAVFGVCLGIYVVIKKSGTSEIIQNPQTITEAPDIDKTPPGLEPIRDALIAKFVPGNPRSVFAVLNAVKADKELVLDCHDIAHDLGHKAYELYGLNDAMSFNNPNSDEQALIQYSCAGGYMHGVLEEMSLHHPEFLHAPENICSQVRLQDRDGCYHGMGHVYMFTDKRHVENSIADCRVITNARYMYRCFEGVRMEQFWGNPAYLGTTTLGWNTNRPFDTCLVARTDERPTCFLYAPFGYLRMHPKDYTGAIQACTAKDWKTADSQFCLKGVGMTMMSKYKNKHLEDTETLVVGFSSELKKAFYQGVFGYAHLAGFSITDLNTTCGLFKVDGDLCREVVSVL